MAHAAHAEQKLDAIIASRSAAQLKEMARLLNTNYATDADIVMEKVLEALEGRMDEAAYVAFCDGL